MSLLALVCTKRVAAADEMARRLAGLSRRFTPDNIKPVDAHIQSVDGVVTAVFNPHATVRSAPGALCAGFLVDPTGWDRTLSGRPDGAYALMRSDARHVELVTDDASSRSIWWHQDEETFIASTSQRVVIALLQGFQFNPAVLPWALASGYLGPGNSWDRRVSPVPGGTSLVLDRQSWRTSTTTIDLDFVPVQASDAEHAERVTAVMRAAIGRANFKAPEWAFPLSGGIDCRTILLLLEDKSSLRTVTWGMRASLKQRGNDAVVGPAVARHFGLPNVFYETDFSHEPVSHLIDRFLRVGEGRVDHLSGYMDGFHVWQTLHDGGVHAIVRGDEAFGRPGVPDGAPEARLHHMRRTTMPMWPDFPELPPTQQMGIPAPTIPAHWERHQGESIETWRDRLQQLFRFPVILSALNDLKVPYVEVASPLMANSILAEVRKLPDHLRSNKMLLRIIAAQLSPPIPEAHFPAIQPLANVFRMPAVAAFLRGELTAARNAAAVPPEFIDFVTGRMKPVGASEQWRLRLARLRRAVRAYFPTRQHLTPAHLPGAPRVNFDAVAFRITVISRMQRILSEDAAALRLAA